MSLSKFEDSSFIDIASFYSFLITLRSSSTKNHPDHQISISLQSIKETIIISLFGGLKKVLKTLHEEKDFFFQLDDEHIYVNDYYFQSNHNFRLRIWIFWGGRICHVMFIEFGNHITLDLTISTNSHKGENGCLSEVNL